MNIIKPFGKPVVRVVIEADSASQVSVDSRVLGLGVAADQPLHPLSSSLLLLQAAVGMLQQLQMRKGKSGNGAEENNNND